MRYRKIDVRIWGDKKFRKLSPLQPSGQALFLYLLTNPNITSIPGIFRAGAALMAEELGWCIEDFKRAFDELLQQGLVQADLDARVIFIPNAIKYNKPQSPNVIKSWLSNWDEIPECDLKTAAYQALKSFTEGMGETFHQAFIESLGQPIGKASFKIMPNQEQEQEQEPKAEIKSLSVPDTLLPSTDSHDLEAMKVSDIFLHWQSVMNHPHAKLDVKRKKKIQAALKSGFTPKQLKQAIEGCANTPFNMGKNETGQRYDSIDLIFRDAEHIERFIQNASAKHKDSCFNSKVSQIDQIAEGAL